LKKLTDKEIMKIVMHPLKADPNMFKRGGGGGPGGNPLTLEVCDFCLTRETARTNFRDVRLAGKLAIAMLPVKGRVGKGIKSFARRKTENCALEILKR